MTTQLRAEAETFGLVTPADQWTVTRLWCPVCGQQRMMGRFEKDTAKAMFELYCPSCNDGAIGIRADLTIAFFANLFGDVKTYKPAYSRLLSTMGAYCRQALKSQNELCVVCGGATFARLGTRTSTGDDGFEVRIICQSCDWETNYSLDSFALLLPKVQKFWRTNSRLHVLPTRKIGIDNTAAFLTRVRSVNCEAGLDIIIAYDTCEVIGVHDV